MSKEISKRLIVFIHPNDVKRVTHFLNAHFKTKSFGEAIRELLTDNFPHLELTPVKRGRLHKTVQLCYKKKGRKSPP